MTPRWLKPVVLGALVVLAVGPFVADARRDARVPDDTAVAEAVRAIRAEFKAGDAVIVNPTWYTVPWHGLEGMGEGTEAWPYPALLLSEDLDPLEASSFSRLWMLAAFDRAADLPAVLDGVAATRTDVPIGGSNVALARYDLTKLERPRTLTRELGDVIVRRGPEGAAQPCKFRGERHRCKDPGLDVRLEDRIVWHHQVQWLFALASPAGQVLEVEQPKLAVPAGGGWYFLRIGWTMEAVRHPEGQSTTVVVLRDGAEIDRFELDPHRYWMERRAYRLAAAGDTTITLRMSTADNGWRELMLQGDLLVDLPAPVRAWATHVSE